MEERRREENVRAQERKQRKRQRTMGLFIAAAEQLMLKEGIAGVTIRRIADITGYSSATLYSYFADLNELVLYASFTYRRAYLEELARRITPYMTSLEQYRRIYEIFNKYSFRDPEIYLNMYFGRHSGKIKAVMESYYQLFPEEFVPPTELVRDLLLQGSLLECDRITTRRLAAEGFIRPENADIVAELMVRTQETFLYEMAMDPQRDIDAQSQAFMQLFDRIIAAF